MLSAASLPRDSDEFYQFCYVSASDRRVRGVSTPFQFVSERQNDWEIVDPPQSDVTMNADSAECEEIQQQQLTVLYYCCFFEYMRLIHFLVAGLRAVYVCWMCFVSHNSSD